MTDNDQFTNEVKSLAASYIETERSDRVLEDRPSNHFGEATSKIQSLLFMIRENEDVFNLFCREAKNFYYELNDGFDETLVNFLFRDLTMCQSDRKLALVMREIIRSEVSECEHLNL